MLRRRNTGSLLGKKRQALAYSNPSNDSLRRLFGEIRTIAVVGASTNPARPVYGVMAYLLRAGYRVIPVNPGQAGREILGQRVYATLADIPEPIDVVDIFRRQEALAGIVDEALTLRPLPKVIWMQLDLVDEAAAAKAQAAGLTVVMDRCIKVDHARLV
jgi:predicted CoA-binding protein